MISVILIILLEVVAKLMLKYVEIPELPASTMTSPEKRPNRSKQLLDVFTEGGNMGNVKYVAFSGWVNPPFKGQYITVNSKGYRQTGIETKFSGKKTLRMFGGSVMWGLYNLERDTPPAITGDLLELNAVNYAERGFNSRQSYNRLLNELSSFNPGDPVVFYDGVNDVFGNCRPGFSADGHIKEHTFRERIDNPGPTATSLSNRYRKLVRKKVKSTSLYKLINRTTGVSLSKAFPSQNECHSTEKAARVADFIVHSWMAAESLLKTKGHPFVCGLQANPYTLNKRIYYHKEDRQDATDQVYPLIREQAKKQGLECFVDFTQLLTEDHFVDGCCHINRDGNMALAKQLAKSIQEKMYTQAITQ